MIAVTSYGNLMYYYKIDVSDIWAAKTGMADA